MHNDQIFSIIDNEAQRQQDYIGLIPSENYASTAVRQAVGSVLMNKYAEGQADKRYYQGNKFIDQIEKLCKERSLQAFELSNEEWGVNVQPHSGSPANLSVYAGLLQPGDRIMSMFLPDGGHLSHGWQLPNQKITFVSQIYDIHFYGVDEKTRVFDYDEIEIKAQQVKPKLLISGGTAYPREIDYKRMSEIAKSVGAYYMTDIAHEAGLVAGKANNSPFPYADVVTMTTHKTLRGPRGAMVFARKPLMTQIDKAIFPGLQGGPHEHTIAGIAVALGEILNPDLQPTFSEYAHQVVKNARVMADKFLRAGLDVVSGGTDKHLILLDLRKSNVSGWVVAWALEYAGIVANRNTVPFETASPFYPSGLRLGTPAVTTRGMKEQEMEQIADWIIDVISYAEKWQLPKDKDERKVFVGNFQDVLRKDEKLAEIRRETLELCGKFPVNV